MLFKSRHIQKLFHEINEHKQFIEDLEKADDKSASYDEVYFYNNIATSLV